LGLSPAYRGDRPGPMDQRSLFVTTHRNSVGSAALYKIPHPCRHPDHDRSHELENRRQREYSALPGIPWNHRSPDHKIRRFSILWRLGIQKNQIPERCAVLNHAPRRSHLCGRLLQLPDRGNRYAPGHRQIQSKPRKTGLHHRRHSSTGLYHRTDLKLGGSRRILPAG